jgi:hypothetical protein
VHIQHCFFRIVPRDIRWQTSKFIFSTCGGAVPLERGQAAGLKCGSAGHDAKPGVSDEFAFEIIITIGRETGLHARNGNRIERRRKVKDWYELLYETLAFRSYTKLAPHARC